VSSSGQLTPTCSASSRSRYARCNDSGSGPGVYTVKGHAAVFNKWSLDLGGFRERVKRGAFDNALSNDPHVLHLWDHDTARALSSTRSKTYPLELRADPAGLYFYSKVAPTSYSEDLRVLLEGGVIDQSSFAFTVARDEWKMTEDTDGNEVVERTILEVDQLFDVTTCAMGAYPTTDSTLAVRNLCSGRDNSRAVVVASLLSVDDVKEDAPERCSRTGCLGGCGDPLHEAKRPVVTPRAPDEGAADKADIARLKAESAEAVRVARERLHRKRDTTP
jgi:HK97 family phage prohead protease